ncbi:hypothetical protein pb186bvf_010028 [Paramecium bursaria]
MIFKKSIEAVERKKESYSGPSPSKKYLRQENEQHPLQIQKSIKKHIILNSDKGLRIQSKTSGGLRIEKGEWQNERQGLPNSLYPIFIRNINPDTTTEQLQNVIQDNQNILGLNISGREANVTFKTQQSADKAVGTIISYSQETINKTTLNGNQLRAVPNYKKEKVIILPQKKEEKKISAKLQISK